MHGTAPLSTLDVLLRARELLRNPANWSPCGGGAPWREAGPHCVALTISHVAGMLYHEGGQEALARAIGAQNDTDEIYEWNDAPERTHADVVAAFDRAIADERARMEEHDAGPVVDIASVCQMSAVDPECDGTAVHDLDGSGEPYLCDSCERRSRGQGGESRAVEAHA